MAHCYKTTYSICTATSVRCRRAPTATSFRAQTRLTHAAASQELHGEHQLADVPSLAPRNIQKTATLDRPLQQIPFARLCGSLPILWTSSHPLLYRPALSLLARIALPSTPPWGEQPIWWQWRLSLTNPAVRWLIRRTLYAQFCAGENAAEVAKTIRDLRQTGVPDVILTWGREIDIHAYRKATGSVNDEDAHRSGLEGVRQWRQGLLDTINLTPPHQFVALKLSGAALSAVKALADCAPPPPAVRQALTDVADAACARGVRLLVDAEHLHLQSGIDEWTLELMRQYNRSRHASVASAREASADLIGAAVPETKHTTPLIFLTSQAYLQDAPKRLARHLRMAAREGFAVGIKLVRGAYLASDPREHMWPTKAQTDRAFDDMAAALIHRDLKPLESIARAEVSQDISAANKGANHKMIEGPSIESNHTYQNSKEVSFPPISLMLATHNLESVQQACHLYKSLSITSTTTTQKTDPSSPPPPSSQMPIELIGAQLYGMADHVTGTMIAERELSSAYDETSAPHSASSTFSTTPRPTSTPAQPRVAKYVVWGSVEDCIAYLVRRGQENGEAATRTRAALHATLWELLHRFLDLWRWNRPVDP